MKLRLPSLLLSAIVALQFTISAQADYVVSGICYDVGKISYDIDDDAKYPTREDGKDVHDTELCWAASGSNLMQYWQDSYKQYADADKQEQINNNLNGYNTSVSYSNPTGTNYLKIYDNVLSNIQKDTTNSSGDFIEWWMLGSASSTYDTSSNPVSILLSQDGYYNTIFTDTTSGENRGCYIEKRWWGADALVDESNTSALKTLASVLEGAFSTQGQAVQINIGGSASHAITCWGYETNEDGTLSALILTDSDDSHFGAFRMAVGEEDLYIGPGMEYAGKFAQVTLNTDDCFGYYGDGENTTTVLGYTYINTANAISNGESIAVKSTADSMPDTLTEGQTITKNTRLASGTGETNVTGNGITVGNGQDIIILTSETGHKLSLNGQIGEDKSNSTGLAVQLGGMVSVDSLSVANYAQGGVKLESKTYIHDGQLSITGNANSVNGAGVDNESYFEIKDCKDSISSQKSVVFSGNHANGKGGAIYNNGSKSVPVRIMEELENPITGEVDLPEFVTTSIRGNGTVEFKDNSADLGGNDIYNEAYGRVIVADNDYVSFNSNSGEKASVTNDGVLYLANTETQNIIFNGTKLDGKGTTYVGTDNWGKDYKGAVRFTGNGSENSLGITGTSRLETVSVYNPKTEQYEDQANTPVWHGAELTNLTVSAEEIVGTANNLWTKASSISNADITAVGMLTMNNVALDTTDIIHASGTSDLVTFENVIITLNNSEALTGKTYDLTGMFNGNFKIKSLYFDVTGLEDFELEDFTINLGESLTMTDIEKAALWLGDNQISLATGMNSGLVGFSAETLELPEPTTGTLGLLALAGLCGRRRRR